ncbi:Tex family protein [Aquella oligotrophica]|uniref:RNA-binding transcriptional accessory protein n=1 Tax=Aquella oligotrophica TaxID=2067065 RepID=A0A2I7N8U5_9NEIS|nr:Tex family protein [Aquella oligotrophica]AUR52655.1 RNA-binding transcriptional accessory protein [Aquella oligotrophica]
MLLSIETRLANLLNINEHQIKNTIILLDEGATVPFIARYRKEVTGGLDDTQLRMLAEKLIYLRELDERREIILKSISEQEKLTPELEAAILAADNKTTLEDLYLPYKPKRRTKAQIAKEAGLEPLTLSLLENQNQDPITLAQSFLNPEKSINTPEEALEGARFIALDIFAENATLLAKLRERFTSEGLITAKLVEGKEEVGIKFTDYFNHQELIKHIPSHRALAILRGNNEGILTIAVEYPEQHTLLRGEFSDYENLIKNEFEISDDKAASSWLRDCVRLAWKAKIYPSLENELISNMRESADNEAIKVFGTNLRNLLLQAPAGSKTTIGLDPGIRTGVKVAVVDNTGKVLNTSTIYPFTRNVDEAMLVLAKLIKAYNTELISIGNGTASRETEQFVKELLKQYKEIQVQIVVVSEAGASVYSASEFAAKEFPDLDVSLRGAVSIARRLQDPLAELVKIDPKSIGVGQYQHDVNQTRLAQTLENVVEDCVNAVGVDVNTASVPLLAKVSGLNSVIANNIVSYRDSNGKFKDRNELIKVSRLGEKTFEQCAGFLRINDGNNPLDKSAVHPESYPLVEAIATKLQVKISDLVGNNQLLNSIKPTDFVTDKYGLPTISDVLKELDKPGRDPRGEFKTAQFKDGVNEITDLQIGMELEGVITNVANFGAFVDIGVHQDGLVHISAIADQYVANPNDVLKVGQIVKVRVEEVDVKRKRIALTMKGLNKLNIPNSSGGAANRRPAKENKPQTNDNSMAAAFAKLKRL